MSQMTINLRPRGATTSPPPPKSCRQELVEYASHALTDEKEKEAVINFLHGNEVKSTRRLKGAIAFVYMTTLAVWGQVIIETTAHAQGLSGQEQQTLDMIDGVLFKIQLICGGICVSLATIMAMVAGIFRLLGLREEAKKRYMDAIAGMTMVLTAPVVLGVLATIVRGILKLFPDYAT
jgi:hypothetical protein